MISIGKMYSEAMVTEKEKKKKKRSACVASQPVSLFNLTLCQLHEKLIG